jgi:2',3'-cyclic-nucleotide 2'-phosphodiesterase (5'-nucleotidase family)
VRHAPHRGRFRRAARLLLLLVLTSFPAFAAERKTLTVLFTSDIHAHVLPFDDVRQRPARGSVAQVATLVAEVRRQGTNPIVLDGGDAIEGTPMEYYALAAPGASGVDPTIAAMNLVRYDAAVLGNHEFDWGLDVLRRSLAQSRFPWLAANLAGAQGAGLALRDHVILERHGVRVAVLGLTNPRVPYWDPPSHWAGLTFADPVEVAARRVAALRGKADVVIVVAHTGFEKDLDTGTTNGSEEENFAWRLAHVPGVDLLLTGHTHHNIPPRRLGDAVVAQPGRWAEVVTRVELTVERAGRRWRVVGWRGENLPTREEAPDPRVVVAVADAHRRTEEALARPVGTLTAALSVDGVTAADDASVDLIHAVQLEASGAQLSLAAPLGSAATEFPAGEVTERLLHALYPYPNTLVVVRLTGAQVLAVLERAVSGWVRVEGSAAEGLTLLRDRRVPPYAFDTLEGATYAVDPTAPVGHRIRDLRVGGAPIDSHASFTVVMNSYRAAGGGGYPYLREAPRVRAIDRPMVELMAAYFRRHHEVSPRATGNWVFTVPLAAGVAR